MKRILLLAGVLFFSRLVTAQINGVDHVIVLGIDALSIDGINSAKTPNLDFIMDNGAYTLHSRGVMPTVSAPNWASIFMGAGPEQHSITSNEWNPKEPPFPSVTGKEKLFPSIFSILKEQRPTAVTAALYDWDKFIEILPKEDLDINLYTKNQTETIFKGLDNFINRKPTLSFFYMGFVDDAGHHYGHGTEEYYSAITEADSLLGVLLKVLKETNSDNSTVVFIVSDHGGIQKGHGGESLREIEIPMFIYGAGVSKGKEISEPVNNFDCASTIAYLLGLKQPDVWIGKPLKSAFSVVESNDQKVHSLVKKPHVFPKGGLFLRNSVPIRIESYTSDAKIYYTTDGTEPTDKSILYKSPFSLSKSCMLKAKAFVSSNSVSITTSESFRIVDSDEPMIKYYYYEGLWKQLPDFSTLTPMDSGRVYEFSLDSIGHREDHFAIKFSSLLNIKTAGKYKFTCVSDDGTRLFIDDILVVDNDGSHSVSEKIGQIDLKAGMHQIDVIYFDDTESEFLELYYEGNGTEKQILPKAVLNRL